MKSHHRTLRGQTRRGAALIIVLAFVVLLTGLVVAFFSSSLLYRQISNSSASQAKVDLFAQGALDTLVGDLKEEIAAGSTAYIYQDRNSAPVRGAIVGQDYQPLNTAAAVPALALKGAQTGVTSFAPNLVKRSAYQQKFYPSQADPGGSNYTGSKSYTVVLPSNGAAPAPSPTNYVPSNRAAQLSSTTPAQNGRYISPARWNKALLLPKPAGTTSDTDLTPDPTAFVAPDWILTARDGSNPGSPAATASFSGAGAVNDPSVSNPGYIVGRYAYAVYDEGGLLDANVAGFPASDVPPYTTANSDLNTNSHKSTLAFADLTQLPGINALSPTRQQAVINNLVGWRNYASAQPGGTLANGYTFGPSQLTNFSTAMLGNLTGFLQAANTALVNGQTDRLLSSRQEMMRLLLNGIAQNSAERANLQTTLQCLGTFSRELNQPSYVPAIHSYPSTAPKVLTPGQGGTAAATFDKEINPNYQTVRVSKVFTRSDQVTQAVVGEPLVNKRFPLQRLAWLTYKGPSQGRPATDPDIKALTDAGIPYSYLQFGTDVNIKFYFGLSWRSGQWYYDQHNNFYNGAASGARGPIMRVGRNPVVDPTPDPTRYVQDLAAPRDPDFFELLKSALTVGSLGKALLSSTSGAAPDAGSNAGEQPYNYAYSLEASVDHQVMQIGANIINQFRADNYPVQIVFDDHQGNLAALSSTTTITGVANLPYLYNVIDGVLQLDPSKASGTNSDGSTATGQLPRDYPGGNGAYTGNLGTGTVGGKSGYKKGDSVTSSGVVALMAMPVIWNPHDPSSSQGAAGLSPTNFRVVADSTTPDQVLGSARNTFFVYGQSIGTDIGEGVNNYYTCYGDANSPGDTGGGSGGNAWYRDVTSNGSKIGHQLTFTNTEIDLTVTGNGNNRPLFPEPTMLVRPRTVIDSNGNSIKISIGANHLMTTDPAVKGFMSNGGLKSFSANPLNMQSSEVQDPAGTPYLGFYLGASPMSWLVSEANTLSASAVQSGCILARVTGSPASSGTAPGSPSACYLTYRMQYQDPSGNWITYDTKYGNVAGASGFNFGCGDKDASLMAGSGGLNAYWSTAIDPRTNRFGLFSQFTGDNLVGSIDHFPAPEAEGQWEPRVKSYAASWLDAANGEMYTVRPDGQPGYHFLSSWPASGATTASGWMAWVGSDASVRQGIIPGLLSQNNTDIFSGMSRVYGAEQGNDIHTPIYFADPDGIVRRGMGAFVPSATTASPTYFHSDNFRGLPSADTTVGLPMARAFGWSGYAPPNPSPTQTTYTGSGSQVTSQAQSRPYFLHRPFRSVAELGHVFSDTPWRNLDFFTSESGSVALLDVFCVNDTTKASPLVAGKVNLNTRQAPVLQAVLAGGYLDTAQPTFNGVTGRLDTVTAKAVATALVARTTDVTNNANGTGPLQNVSDLVGKWIKNMAIGQLPVGSSPSALRSETNQGTLSSPTTPNVANPLCYDGKLSYAGFSGGVWDNTSMNLGGTARKPFINGVEDFSMTNGNPKPTGTAMDVYSAYMNSVSTFTPNSPDNHNGPKETAGYVQRFREAPIRALAASGQTRVWNLMVDLVAQTGRYPANASALSKFVVEGEQRYWVHLAIDRYTGNVIDKQIEVVKE